MLDILKVLHQIARAALDFVILLTAIFLLKLSWSFATYPALMVLIPFPVLPGLLRPGGRNKRGMLVHARIESEDALRVRCRYRLILSKYTHNPELRPEHFPIIGPYTSMSTGSRLT